MAVDTQPENLPRFAQTPKTATVVTTGACGSIGTDTPSNTVQLLQAGTKGCIVTRLTAIPRASVAGDMGLVLFESQDSGTTQRLIDSEVMKVQAIGTNTVIAETTFANYSETRPMRLGANDRLYVGNQIAFASGVVWKVEYTEFATPTP